MKQKLKPGMNAPNFNYETISQQSLDFYKNTEGKKSVIFFLRYIGCPVCHMKIRDILSDNEKFNAAGLQVYAVLQSTPASVREEIDEAKMPFTIVCDPEEKVFALYGVAPGNLFGYLTPSVIMKAMKASRAGFKHGKKEGKEMQLPAVFIIDGDRKITYAHYGKNIGDVPDNQVILKAARV